MSAVDRQRIGAVKTIETLGYTFDGFVWTAPSSGVPLPNLYDEADAMHSLLVLIADKLDGCVEGSEEDAEFKRIAETLEVYEAKRWPDGAAPRMKG